MITRCDDDHMHPGSTARPTRGMSRTRDIWRNARGLARAFSVLTVVSWALLALVPGGALWFVLAITSTAVAVGAWVVVAVGTMLLALGEDLTTPHS